MASQEEKNEINNVGSCVWYGVCKRIGLKTKNCLYEGSPKRLNTTGVEALKHWCSHLLPDKYVQGDPVSTCCDEQQLHEFNENIKIASSLLNRCPSCMQNFARHICDFTCNPKQSDFIKVKNIKLNEHKREYLI